jgi:hypothetical protein
MGTHEIPDGPRRAKPVMAGDEARRVRVLNGPLRGAAHVVRHRLGIGRASSSDIQLVHDGISRHHAQIVTDDQGRHVLVDLDSSNGTFVDGQRIHRQVLTPGTVFTITRVELVYEAFVDEPFEGDASEVFAVDRLDAETQPATTDDHPQDPPQPVTPRQRVAAETRPAPAAMQHAEPDPPVHPSAGRRSSAGSPVPARGEERHPIVATRHDRTIYDGSLIDDIVEYRDLRIRIERGDPIEPHERRAFEVLGVRLRTPPGEAVPPTAPGERAQVRRELERFRCSFPARLRLSTSDELAATVLDLGVDGTRLRVLDHQIEHDAIVWLAIHLVSRGRPHTVVFTGRVAWTCRDHLGLGFAGAPGWEHVGHRKVAVRTHMDLREQLRAARATLGRTSTRD